MNIQLGKILGADIRAASYVEDIDAALASLQEKASIADGGIASIVFSGFNWIDASPDERIEKIAEWIETERAALPPEQRGTTIRHRMQDGFAAQRRRS